MVFDLRYHIFTITAIFAALGLGILIGTSIIGNDRLIEEQNKIISNIGDNISKLKTENSKLKSDINSLKVKLSEKEEREIKLLSLLAGDSFSGNKYLLYTENGDEVNKVKEIFNNAGVELKILTDRENIKTPGESCRLILWNTGLHDIAENIKKNSILCNKNDVFELIIAILENGKNAEEGQ